MNVSVRYQAGRLTGAIRKWTLGVCCMAGFMGNAAAQDAAWAVNMGGTGDDYGNAVATDARGNVYVTGYFSATADFDPAGGAALTTAGSLDAFLSKYDAAGNYVWVRQMGGEGADAAYGLAIDTSGNIFVTGSFNGTADFNPGGINGSVTSDGNSDVFLAKFDSAGVFQWVRKMGGAGLDLAGKVAVDLSGNAYVTGSYFESAGFAPAASGVTVSAAGGHDVFLVKYDPSGDCLWANTMGGGDADQGRNVATDASGNVYVTGSFGAAGAHFDPGVPASLRNSAGREDIFLAKYDAAGNYLWAHGLGGSSFDYAYGIATDGAGDVYITGYFNSPSAAFDPSGSAGTLTQIGGYDVFLAKYNAAGAYQWARNMGGTGGDFGVSVKTDLAGNLYISGRLNSAAPDFNPGGSGGALTGLGSDDIFVAKYDAAGNYYWAKIMGSSGYENGIDAAVDRSGSVYVTGMFNTAIDFIPGTTVTPEGGLDVFLVKLACADTTSSHLTIAECSGLYTLNGKEYTTTGIYRQYLPNAAGCDSVLTLDLTMVKVEPALTVDSFVLGVEGSYAAYQWVRDGADIPGETAAVHSATENGRYQVRVTDTNGCEGTSAVYTINNLGVHHTARAMQPVQIYPNPSGGVIHIRCALPLNAVLSGLDGSVILRQEDAQQIDISELPRGLYMLHLRDIGGKIIRTEKIVKE